MPGKRDKDFDKKFEELFGPVTPQQIAVIVGLLTRVLRVRAVVLDVEQNIEIILEGRIRKNGNIKKMMNQLNDDEIQDWLLALQSFRGGE